MPPFSKRIAAVAVILLTLSVSQAGTVVIYEKPSALIVYDRYERRTERAPAPFTPFMIIDEDWTLGDGFSKAVKTSVGDNVFYILKSSAGVPEGIENAGKTARFSAQPVNRAVVMKKETVTVRQGFFPGNRDLASEFQTQSYALFLYNGYYYLSSEEGTVFGWSPASLWGLPDVVRPLKNTAALPEELAARVTSVFDRANELYAALFDYFKEKTGSDFSVPRWRVTREGAVISAAFTGSRAVLNQFESSKEAVIREVSRAVMGFPFSVDVNGEVITIRPDGGFQ